MTKLAFLNKLNFLHIYIPFSCQYTRFLQRFVHKNVEMWIARGVFFDFDPFLSVCININWHEYL